MNEVLSRIVADLFEKSNGGEELSSRIQRVRDEIKKVIESDTIFGKFRGLVESFREVIPEEKQRYNAAIKALSTTSKLSEQEIIKAVNSQLEELKILEKSLMPAEPGRRDELKIMEAKSQEMRGELSKLREQIARLEREEKGILNGIAAREKELELVEKAMKELFTNIGAEITHIKKKVEEFIAQSPAAQPSPPRNSVKSDIPGVKKGDNKQTGGTDEPSPQQDAELQRKCPMCGGRMDFQINGEKWMCYSCAYEELKNDEVQDKIEAKPFPPSDSVKSDIPSKKKRDNEQKGVTPSTQQDAELQKKCPMCGGRMDFQINGEKWMCYSCAYEELRNDEVQDKIEESEHANAPKTTTPKDSVKSNIPSEKKGGSGRKSRIGDPSAEQDTELQRKCPMCGGHMDFQINGEKWMCYSCAYEELKEDEAQDKIEKKSENTNVPKPTLTAEPTLDQSPSLDVSLESFSSTENQESKKASSPSDNQPSTKKKPCPACSNKMQWHQTEKAWRCPFCGYERSI